MIPPIANNFVAGTSPQTALDHTQEVNQKGVDTILNLLGEHYESPQPARSDTEAYTNLIRTVNNLGASACISVKPSQIGIDIGPDEFESNLETITQSADTHDVFVWIDMEDHTTTDATLDTFERLNSQYSQMGICVQANLKRTRDDLHRLEPLPGKVRLVKGAYNEPASIAYQEKDKVNDQYKAHLRYLFEEWNSGIAVGSHDPEMVDFATQLHEEYGTDFEIQMLMGVREDAQYRLATDYPMYQYVPYGDKWMSYFYRRIRERKENLAFALKAILSN